MALELLCLDSVRTRRVLHAGAAGMCRDNSSALGDNAMKKIILASVCAFALAAPSAAYAAERQRESRGRKRRQDRSRPARGARPTMRRRWPATICFTCGGDWPVFAGFIRSVGDTPRERGPSCSGPSAEPLRTVARSFAAGSKVDAAVARAGHGGCSDQASVVAAAHGRAWVAPARCSGGCLSSARVRPSA